MIRPDLVDVWIFREGAAGPEILLLRRAAGRILAGLWQCVSGSVEAGERVVEGALRELAEETGLAGPSVDAFFDLDLVNQFHWAPADAIVSAAVFAVRVLPGVEPVLSHEHDAARWLPLESALAEVVWPGYREAIRVIAEDLFEASRARWFELTLDGVRLIG